MKTKISLLLTLFLLLASCQQEMPVVAGASAGKGHISFTLATMASGDGTSLIDLDFKSVSSKASAMLDAEENKVKRMDVVIFNASTGAYLSTFTQSTVDVSDFTPTFPANTKGVTCNIYFIANLKEAPAVSTFSEANFKLSNCGLTTLTQSDVVSYGIPMCGSLLGCAIPADGIITNAPVTLTRLLARVDIVYSNAVPAQFTATSIQLCNVPSITPYYSPATIDATYYSGMTVADLDPETTLPVDGTATTFTYYVPANRRGIDINPNNIDSRLKNGVGITNPTNVKVGGKQVSNGASIFYTFYLGGNSTTDYNLLANTKYTVNASIKGISVADSRVTKIEPESNCYMVAPGSTIYIPVSRAEAGNTELIKTGTGTGFTSSSGFTVGLLWSDVSSTHVSAEALVLARCVKVVVPANAPAGNSIVYALSGGKIVWSWHIWVTAYAPSTTANTGTNSTTYSFYKDLWMDRNLGATSKLEGDVSSYGFHYQWGRKDPFPSSSSIKSGVEVSVYQQYPTVKQAPLSPTILPTTAVGSNNLVASINNPSVFYCGTYTNTFDWYSSIANTRIDNLWYNGINSPKTIYDPCPVGWRVPFGTINVTPWVSPWNGLVKPATTWNFGYTWEHGGYYPAAGYRNGSDWALNFVGYYGFYWSASSGSPGACYLTFGNGGVEPSYFYGRANGFSVRCVQE